MTDKQKSNAAADRIALRMTNAMKKKHDRQKKERKEKELYDEWNRLSLAQQQKRNALIQKIKDDFDRKALILETKIKNHKKIDLTKNLRTTNSKPKEYKLFNSSQGLTLHNIRNMPNSNANSRAKAKKNVIELTNKLITERKKNLQKNLQNYIKQNRQKSKRNIVRLNTIYENRKL